MKFKVGDLLRITNIAGPGAGVGAAGPEIWRGKICLCVKVMQTGPPGMTYCDYEVLVGDEGKICFYENELEIVNKGNGNE